MDSEPEFNAWIQGLDSELEFKAWIQRLDSKPGIRAWIQNLSKGTQLEFQSFFDSGTPAGTHGSGPNRGTFGAPFLAPLGVLV